MANDNRSGTTPLLSFLVGALLVVAIGGAVLAYTGDLPFAGKGDDQPSVTIKLPDVDVTKKN